MAQFSFKDYAPSLSAKVTAEEILQEILKLHPESTKVEIDMDGMVAMTTICARVIFGGLYTQLGKETFQNNILITKYTESIRIVINWGIESAIELGKQ